MKDKRFLIALIGFSVLITAICFFPYWFTKNGSVNFQNTGQIGDTIGGIMGPFIAIIASALTFLAFWVQFEANNEQKKQFAIQNQDQLFFRLIDSQESKIINSSFIDVDTETEISGFQVMEHIVIKFKEAIIEDSRLFAREIVRTQFETLEEVFYHKIFDANNIPFDLREAEKENFINTMRGLDHNQRWEHIKTYFNSLTAESSRQLDVLEAIGSVYFYRAAFERRRDMYNIAFQMMEKEYGSFLDGYLKNWEFLARLVDKSLNKDFYINYVNSHLSKFEKVLLFYYLASGKCTNDFKNFGIQNGLLDGLVNSNLLLIDAPSAEELNEEINNIEKYQN